MPAEITISNEQETTHQQQTFVDAEPFQQDSREFQPRTATVTTNGMDISHFFERPILLNSYEWDDNATFMEYYSPWFSYFTHPTISPKLKGFARLVADLEVELRINGSPFRFGQILASYRPLFNPRKRASSNPVSLADYSGGFLPEDGCRLDTTWLTTVSGSTDMTLMARSQRQCAYIDVASSSGCKFVFPFIHPFNSLRVSNVDTTPSLALDTLFGQELQSMGTLFMESISTLRNMQVATTAGVTIDLFVRAVNVRAWMSSGVATMEPQGDERKPSQYASALASTASIFKHVPIIGSYATLVETIANGGSKILQFFGYTPRPDVSLPNYVTGYSLAIEPSVTFPKKVRNLGLDHQNNVVVDPAAIGGDSSDPLALASFCKRPAMLCRTYFASSLAVGDATLILPVCPFHAASALQTDPDRPNMRRIQMIPCSLAALNFRYWRGTMCVRFQAIKSAFHRGRLRVTWDPEIGSYNTSTQADLGTIYEGYQQMLNWDLSSSDSLTVKIGFGARKGRLTVPRMGVPGLTNNSYITNTEAAPASVSSATITVDNYEDYFNGFLRLSVLTRLQAPDVTYPVPITVHVWYEDMEFYDPLENGPSLSTFSTLPAYPTTFPTDSATFYGTVFQGEDIENLMTRPLCYDTMYPQGDEIHVFQPTTVVEDSLYEGEKVGSLRALLQRDTFYDTISFEIPRAQVQPNNGSGLSGIQFDIPPTLCTRMLPVYPFAFGTDSPSRSTVQTVGTSVPTYTFTGTSGTTRTYCPNMARTNLFPLLRECFIGVRGSYNWKFVPLVESGCRIKLISAARSNFTHPAYSKIGSFPRNVRCSPYSGTDQYTTDGPELALADSSAIIPMVFDSGAIYTAPVCGTRSTLLTSQNRLSSLRRFLNGYIGSFTSGSMLANSKEQTTLGVRVPYFSLARFLPGSVTGWMNGNSNGELSQCVRLTVLTEGSPALTNSGSLLSNTSAVLASQTSIAAFNGPGRSALILAAICSAGDDLSFGGFVSVPALFMTSASVFTTAND